MLMENFECWMPDWEYIHKSCLVVARKIKDDGFRPDIIIALSRGGFVPARDLCDSLMVKDLVSIKVDHWGVTASKDGKASIRYPIDIDLTGKNVLIVDDITDTGESMEVSVDFALKKNPREIRTATVFHIRSSKFRPDYFGEEIDWKWVIFPWNFYEDMRNIVPKALESSPLSRTEILSKIKRCFKLELGEDTLSETLYDLKKGNLAIEEEGKWKAPVEKISLDG